MSGLEAAVVAAYFGILGLLALYGGHRSYLLLLYVRHAGRPARPRGGLDPLPRVTVQLPIYNERYVVERLIEAACRLDYPADRLDIQVLDDSTDDTWRIAARAIERMREGGHDIVHMRRQRRDGFKAGALAAALPKAKGEFIAVFDADFVPAPGFLHDLIHHFSRPRVGMVQARWGHLNREHSLLTRVQSILLDGHFAIEHAARHRAGLFFNFNGTAGIWRRACIESAGGWDSDTLTEDLDLSYRAQLSGWQFVFVPEVTAPAELPADIGAFRSQQHRWTRGSIETGLKLLPRLLTSRLPARVKIEGLFHLTNNSAYLLMVLLAALLVPATAIRHAYHLDLLLWIDLPLFVMTTVSLSCFYVASQREVGAGVLQALASLPFLVALGIGLSLNNARAVLGALKGSRVEFVRTPKYSLTGRTGRPRHGAYAVAIGSFWVGLELLLGVYFTAAAAFALQGGMYASLPFLLLFQSGFLYASSLSLASAWERRAARRDRAPAERLGNKRLDAAAPASYMTGSKSS